MRQETIKLQQIEIDNATQRTMTILGGKGTGKTTLLKMLMKQVSPVVVFDPLNVIDSKSIDAYRIKISNRFTDEDTDKAARVINIFVKKGKNVVVSCVNMVREEEIELVNLLIPKLNLKDCYVFIDEVHEFAPLHSGSLEIERFIRHCRNQNVGIIMTSQRPASIKKDVLALTDYLILFRITWTHDIEAIRDLIKNQCDKNEQRQILSQLQRFGFMEGYVIDYRS